MYLLHLNSPVVGVVSVSCFNSLNGSGISLTSTFNSLSLLLTERPWASRRCCDERPWASRCCDEFVVDVFSL